MCSVNSLGHQNQYADETRRQSAELVELESQPVGLDVQLVAVQASVLDHGRSGGSGPPSELIYRAHQTRGTVRVCLRLDHAPAGLLKEGSRWTFPSTISRDLNAPSPLVLFTSWRGVPGQEGLEGTPSAGHANDPATPHTASVPCGTYRGGPVKP